MGSQQRLCTTLVLQHSTVHFRMSHGRPEVLIEHGCDGGAAYIFGREDISGLICHLQQLLAIPESESGA